MQLAVSDLLANSQNTNKYTEICAGARLPVNEAWVAQVSLLAALLCLALPCWISSVVLTKHHHTHFNVRCYQLHCLPPRTCLAPSTLPCP